MRIEYSRKFEKAFNKAPVYIQDTFKERLLLFVNNPFSPILRNHALSGSLNHFRSINITGDWRAIFEELTDRVTFSDLGTHSQLYD